MTVKGRTAQGRRLDLDRRHDRRGHRGQDQHQALRGPPGPDRKDPRPGQGARLPDLRQGHDLGRQVPDPQDPDQRRPARPVGQRRGLRRRRHRPLPDRAHVLRRGQDRPDARDDPGRHGRTEEDRPGQAPAPPAAGLRRHLRGHGRTAGDDPDDRPAAPRVPAPRGEGPARDRGRDGHLLREGQGARRLPPRVQSHARLPRLPPRHHLSRDHRDAGPGHLRGRRGHEEEEDPRPARGHDPARRPRQGAPEPGEARPGHGRGRHEGTGHQVRLPRRDDDRGPARRHHRRRDRGRGRVLQLRHERPDPDDARRQPRRRGPLPRPLRREGDLRQGPVRGHRPGRRRPAHAHGRREGPQDAAGDQARHLRRARRRAVVGRVLPPHRAELRQLLALPGAHRPPRGGPGGHPERAEGRGPKKSAKKPAKKAAQSQEAGQYEPKSFSG